MPGRYIFDLESDGLLNELTKIHCLALIDIDTGKPHSFDPREVQWGVGLLTDADLIVGHNIIGFDIPALEKVYGFKTRALVRDTLVCTRLMWPHVKDDDFRRKNFPKQLIGRHSLEAWGHRLGKYKGDYKGGWENWSPEMHEYMEQDVRVTYELWQRIVQEASRWGVPLTDDAPPPRLDCIELEHRVASIVEQVQGHGFRFNSTEAAALYAKISSRKAEVERELLQTFPPREVVTIVTPKATNKKYGNVKGVPREKRTSIVFNPASRQEVGVRLRELGWKPTAFGKDGSPTVDEEILASLTFPQAKLLSEFYMLDKRLGTIGNGKEAWLRHEKNGRLHGRIHSGGAHTGRMTHSNPNLAQVPGNHAPFGEECRSLFRADPGHVLVGCDADALELRDLAGYMAAWDDGAYVETVLRGDKSRGTDMHTLNAKAIGCSRDEAKVFFYAMIYGAGDAKLGETLGKDAAYGKKARENLMKGVPALGALIKAVQDKMERVGYITGLDGRRLRARSRNAALNTLLQSAGAVQMKRGLVLLYDRCIERGWEWGKDFAIVALVHDEFQASVRPELADEYGQIAVQAIRDAGSFYSFKCPLDGQYKIGGSWKETH
jgi:DNA polymerase I